MLDDLHCPDYDGVPEYGGPCWTCQGTDRCPIKKEIEKMKLVLYRGNAEWSALYNDGVLETVGDHYVAEERVFELLGVDIINSDAFMCGGDSRKDVAPTLSAVATYENKRELALDRAKHLRVEADKLLVEALELDAEWK